MPDLLRPPTVGEAAPPSVFDFCFVVCDVGAIVVQQGPTLNLVRHACMYLAAEPGKRTEDMSAGIFT
eukprot:COSAG01_NODE_2484_length_7600_cov_2.596587_3_plen_67_part_00